MCYNFLSNTKASNWRQINHSEAYFSLYSFFSEHLGAVLVKNNEKFLQDVIRMERCIFAVFVVTLILFKISLLYFCC